MSEHTDTVQSNQAFTRGQLSAGCSAGSCARCQNGFSRHFEELKLQLIDQAYTILPGEARA